MEKKIWTRPLAEVEQFMANDYIAKCSDTKNYYYEFKCNAGGGASGRVYHESNGTAGLQTGYGGDESYGGYHACGIEHYVEAGPNNELPSEFIENCYYKQYSSGWYEYDPINVIVWKGENGDNLHCTTTLINDFKLVAGNRS